MIILLYLWFPDLLNSSLFLRWMGQFAGNHSWWLVHTIDTERVRNFFYTKSGCFNIDHISKYLFIQKRFILFFRICDDVLMDFDDLVRTQTGLGTAAVIVMNKQVSPTDNRLYFMKVSFEKEKNLLWKFCLQAVEIIPRFRDWILLVCII